MISLTKFGIERGFGGQCCGDSPLAAEEKIHCGVLLGKSLRRARESEAFECVHEAMELLVVEQATDFFVMIEEVGANGEELIALGHVDAGSDDDFFGGDVEVEAAARSFFKSVAGPPGGHVAFVGALVRGEAGIAVDAHHALLRGAHVRGREIGHGGGDLLDNFEHGLLEFAFEDWLTGFEPLAAIVVGQTAKKLKGFRSEVRVRRRRRSWLAIRLCGAFGGGSGAGGLAGCALRGCHWLDFKRELRSK